MYDFANLLFAGPCNARCPFCIGRQIDPRLSANNLQIFPPRNLDRFVELILACAIKQVVFTGTTTDPQLYQHEARLLDTLRARLPDDTQIAVHTNGRLALKKIDVFNRYDRACLSFPSFYPIIYEKMMGVRGVPDLARIVERARIPVKVSCVINEHNCGETPEFLKRCQAMGVKRLVFRQLLGDARVWPLAAGLSRRGAYRGNPVYDYQGMEITYWNFDQAECASINLFGDGTISTDYLLAKA